MAQGEQTHPQRHWVGGQAMHGTQELGMEWGGHGPQQARRWGRRHRRRRERGGGERAELPPIPWAQGDAGATVPGVFLFSFFSFLFFFFFFFFFFGQPCSMWKFLGQGLDFHPVVSMPDP